MDKAERTQPVERKFIQEEDAVLGFHAEQKMCDTQLTLDAPGAAEALARCYSLLRRWGEEAVQLNAAAVQHDSEPRSKTQEVRDAE